MNSKIQWIPVLGIAFVFLYFGADKFIHPEIWTGWIPPFLNGFLGIDKNGWNLFAGITEVLFGLLVLIPRVRFWGALGMTLELLFITVALTRFSEIGIRDIGLLTMVIYVMLENSPYAKPRKR